jgi:hypothetical protein
MRRRLAARHAALVAIGFAVDRRLSASAEGETFALALGP